MSDVSISEAIALFDHSETARGAKGAVGKWPLRVVERLRYLHDIEEIGFTAPDTKTKGGIVAGEWGEDPKGFDLVLNPAYFRRLPEAERLPAVSLVLVHEGVHATGVLDYNWLYDEMMGRQLEVYYFRELAGPGVVNVLTGKRVWIGKSESFDSFRAMSRYLEKHQLVDHVLSYRHYTSSDYLDADWVVDNFDNWGGIKNRWPKTKVLYVKKLLPVAVDTHYAVRILSILESIETREEWDRMVRAIKKMGRDGTLRTLQVSFDAPLGVRDFAARVARLEQRWGTPLTERPGVR